MPKISDATLRRILSGLLYGGLAFFIALTAVMAICDWMPTGVPRVVLLAVLVGWCVAFVGILCYATLKKAGKI